MTMPSSDRRQYSRKEMSPERHLFSRILPSVCDSKVNFDDNAEFRQKEIFDKRDVSQENPIEVEAKKYDLNYIKLDGSVACMVNGAGLAMSTMDLLSSLGGSPANFLDVGGASTAETMTAAFKIIMGDPNVKSIFVNIS